MIGLCGSHLVLRCCTRCHSKIASNTNILRYNLYMVLYPRFVVGILTVPFSFRDVSISGFGRHFRLSVIIRIAYRYTFMVECRSFAVGMLLLMVYVIVSEILVLPVIWLPSWISRTLRRPTVPRYRKYHYWKVWPSRKHGSSRWNFVAMWSRTRDMPGGHFIHPVPPNVAKTVAGRMVS